MQITLYMLIADGYREAQENGSYVKYTNGIEDTVYYTREDEHSYVSSTLIKTNSSNLFNKLALCVLPFDSVKPLGQRDFIFSKNLRDSYLNFKSIEAQALRVSNNPSSEFHVKALMIPVLGHYFKPGPDFSYAPEYKSGKGQVDAIVMAHQDDGKLYDIGCCELKSEDGDSWTSLFQQATEYAEADNDTTSLFVICVKGLIISFFMYTQDWHSSNGFRLKGKEFDGLLGLYVDKDGVKVLPLENTYAPPRLCFMIYFLVKTLCMPLAYILCLNISLWVNTLLVLIFFKTKILILLNYLLLRRYKNLILSTSTLLYLV